MDEGQPKRDLAVLRWGMAHACHEIETALVGVMDNLPNRPVAWLLRAVAFPLGLRHRPPSDRLGEAVARGVLEDSSLRDALTADIHVPAASEGSLGRLEAAYAAVVAAQPAERKLKEAVRARKLPRVEGESLLLAGLKAGIVSEEEARLWRAADIARRDAIQVDAFGPVP